MIFSSSIQGSPDQKKTKRKKNNSLIYVCLETLKIHMKIDTIFIHRQSLVQ